MSESRYHSAFRNVLNLAERVQVIKEYESFPRPRILDLANKYCVCDSQIRNIIFNQETILKDYEAGGKNKFAATEKGKRDTADASKSELPANPELGEDNNLSALSVADRLRVIHDYNYKNPKPTISSLAAKYNVSSRRIINILLSQESSLRSYKTTGHDTYTQEETMEQGYNQRQVQIQFLGMVMYEYLQRAVYHNHQINDLIIQKKATQVKKCIGLHKFRPTYLWLNGFKRKYGIDDLNSELLRDKIMFTDEKERSLDVVDMVRYVRQHKNSLLQLETKLLNPLPNSTQSETLVFSGNNVEIDDNEILKTCERYNIQTDSSEIAVNEPTIKIEISPTQLSEYTGPRPIVPHVSTHKSQKDNSVSKTLDQHMNKTDINCISIGRRKSKVGTVIIEKDLLQKIGEKDDCITISQIVDDKTPTSRADDNSGWHSLSGVENDSQKPDISSNTPHGITIKTELQLNDDQSLETNDNQIPTYRVSENVNVTPEKYHTSQFNEDIKPALLFKTSGNFVSGNNNDTNCYEHSPRLATGKLFHLNSPLPDIDSLEEAMAHLKVLEHYVMLTENFRAIGLIAQLEEAIKKPPKL